MREPGAMGSAERSHAALSCLTSGNKLFKVREHSAIGERSGIAQLFERIDGDLSAPTACTEDKDVRIFVWQTA